MRARLGGAYIIDSMTTGTKRIIYGNVPNRGLTSNLPVGSCVEVACLASDLGVRPMAYGELPAACAALNNVQINVQSLVVRAALEASPELVYTGRRTRPADQRLAHAAADPRDGGLALRGGASVAGRARGLGNDGMNGAVPTK